MKRLIALVVSLMLLCGFAALAEAEGGTKMNCLIDEGSYIIQIDDPEGDMGWQCESGDESIVRLYDADLIEDTFVVRFDPVSDGEATVCLKHFAGIACDEMHTFDLVVKDGAVAESTGGSYTAAPDPAEMDPDLLGQWQTLDGMNVMTVEKNPGGAAWDVEIVGAASHDAYVFKTTVCYDCALDAFVYDKGKFWDAPITDGEDEAELGEAKTAGTTGSFTFAGDASALRLSWSDAERAGDAMEFARADGSAVAQDEIVRRFTDTWVAEGFSAEIGYDETAAAFSCEMALNDDSFCDFSDCAYDAAAGALVCTGGTRYFATYNDEKADYDREVVGTDVAATFTFDAETLTCEDSMGMLAGVTFMRLYDSEAADAAAEASELYSTADMDAAIIAINREFSGWEGCEMHDIRYAGDDVNNAENLAWMCSMGEKEYAQVISFLSDFHSPVEGGGAWEADKEYRDWQWWLARTEGGDWELLTWGY